MRRCVAVSPHLDDAVFSAGERLAALAADGWQVEVVTVFTASVADPTGFALACQTDKGLAPDVDYMALRRAEDLRACARLGARARHLELREAPHRGYASPAELFAELRHDDDGVVEEIAAALAPSLAKADLVLTCAGIGDHVDHRRVLQALAAREDERWRDLPYGLDDIPGAPQSSPALEAKLDACAAYATQLGFQFGGEPAMRDALGRQQEVFAAAGR